MAARRITSDAIAELDDRFADNLAIIRTRLGMSRRELAERTGISVYSIESFETDRPGHPRRRATIGEAVVLAEALGVKPGDMLNPRTVAP